MLTRVMVNTQVNAAHALISEVSLFNGLTPEALAAALVESMMEHLEDVAPPEVTASITKPTMKWRHISSMQKAIRRGQSKPAIASAIALHRAGELNALWRRLVIISIEDVGIGALPTCALISTLCNRKAWVEKNSPETIIAYVVGRLCDSVKDRALCNFAVVSNRTPKLNEIRGAFASGTLDAASLLDRGNEDDPTMLHQAAKACAGAMKVTVDGVEKVVPANVRAFFDWLSTYPDTLLQYVVNRAVYVRAEALPFGFPMLYERFKAEAADVHVKKNTLPKCVMIGGVISAAFDKHTFEGKRAIAYYAKRSDAVRHWQAAHDITPYRLFAEALGRAVFVAEGGEPLDTQLIYPTQQHWLNEQLEIFSDEAGISRESFDALVDIVASEIDVLNESRVRVIG